MVSGLLSSRLRRIGHEELGRAGIAPFLDGAPAGKEIGNVGEVEYGSRSSPHSRARTEGDEGARPMTLPIGLRRSSVKDWTAADDELLRELSLKGIDAREIGIDSWNGGPYFRKLGHGKNVSSASRRRAQRV